MARGANADQRSARFEIRLDERQLFRRRHAPTHAYYEQVSMFQCIETREIILVLRVGMHKGAAQAAFLQLLFGEGRQRLGGAVLVLTDQENNVRHHRFTHNIGR